ncbi:hypothetical protein N825_25765 [Skermanella stibiiresistens SB22]|uniref:DUF4214 domain-containing protein n=1 Tax=Skermanella stibiiresistens SB22 TaxID=1385369 RepID=W9GWB7_9PROT|nr:DUF4214 domain-containing protein [Skermanella stibiiresistens]EWY36732.1 hypothetical protein N825_25765 [Skermanella stibiiresistens SB22]
MITGPAFSGAYFDGGPGADRMRGGTKSDIYLVDNPRDVIVETYEHRFENGVNPVDTAIWAAPQRGYSISLGQGRTDAVSFGGGAVAVENIERLVFTDGEFRTDSGDVAAQIYRLYGATLDRAPDSGGLKNWLVAVEKGALTLRQAADGLTASPEFQIKYGNVDDGGFVDLMYDNVLHRDPDPEGFNAWVNALANGMSRSELVLGFSESLENVQATRAGVERGLWVGDDQAAMVARLYDTTLDRMPDAEGLTAWTNAVKAGVPLQQAANGFMGSPEFQRKYGALDDTGFVRQLYRNVLDREGDAPGVEAWSDSLRAGNSRDAVVLGFSESVEHQIKLAPYIDDGIWLL